MGNSKQNLPSPAKLSKNYSGSSSIYTPKQLVSLVVEGVDHLLKLKFGVKKGIISEKVAILDPAVGMLAFPLGCLNFAHKTMEKKDFDKWVKNAFVGKYFCFEVNKLTVKKAKKLLKETLENAPILNKLQGVDSKKLVSNFEIHLGNTLSSPNPKEKTNEEKQFLYLRRNLPFTKSDKLLVIGNPPWAISSSLSTKNKWIKSLVNDYKKKLQAPHRKRIRGFKALQDEYVKFLRFAQWKLCDQNREGVVAFVLNNYFLDGMIFRGMRASLLEDFDEIYIINLFGDPKKHYNREELEVISQNDGDLAKDENIFNIQTGVCVFFGFRHLRKGKRDLKPNSKKKRNKNKSKVKYYGIVGTRKQKLKLLERGFRQLHFVKVPSRVDYQFLPANEDFLARETQYFSFQYLPEIFAYNMIGAQSLHDTLVTHPDKKRLVEIVKNFYLGKYEQHEFLDKKGQKWVKHNGVSYHDARDWKINEALEGGLEKALGNIISWHRKGLDKWWVCFDEHLMTRGSSSFGLLQFMLPFQNNVAIGSARVSRKVNGENSVLMADSIVDSHFIEGGWGIGDYLFPLKIHRKVLKAKGWKPETWNHPLDAIHYNFALDFLHDFFKKYSINASPIEEIEKERSELLEEIFYYIYAVLWSPLYRTHYRRFLGDDFPRIKFPKHYNNLKKMASIGRKLAIAHLPLRNSNKHQQWVSNHGWDMDLPDWNQHPKHKIVVKKPKYDEKRRRIYLNEDNWIGPVEQEVWEFKIGGIKQLKSWLKHRRLVSKSSSKRYGFTRGIRESEYDSLLQMICSIEETLKIQKNLERVHLEIEQAID